MHKTFRSPGGRTLEKLELDPPPHVSRETSQNHFKGPRVIFKFITRQEPVRTLYLQDIFLTAEISSLRHRQWKENFVKIIRLENCARTAGMLSGI